MEHAGRLKERKPRIPQRQRDHDDDLENSERLARNHAHVVHVLVNNGKRGEQEADEVGLHECTLDFSLIDFPCSPYHDALRGDEAAVETDEHAGDSLLSAAFREEEERSCRREHVPNDSDEQAAGRVDGEQRIQPLAWREVELHPVDDLVAVEAESAASTSIMPVAILLVLVLVLLLLMMRMGSLSGCDVAGSIPGHVRWLLVLGIRVLIVLLVLLLLV
mmetsp:Transcript_27087/g.76224  ORF Transcript_27087/g.76224 Transcript_27087/m.76224 type:complete len:219 (-) Transcript_27087:145-801(-)|eukprot:CAMPEP_0119555064 /NCGR_PEP_ID=MMETSP1352-20130426/7391_1 /TAXON_ID=265584 /ORGANISM="Stauroneis constricta, Strain CCMP1120" /LENGTH=218 /DNA_ID=CAMNT_0007601769 /DNA_START=232 /DNA_END=888 /DNA_ORIENTATION=-